MADDLNLAGLTKIVTVLTAIAYATGVVAINTYLHELGIADFSFAKPKLLLTGITILFSLLLLSSHLFFLAWALASRHGPVERTLPRLNWVVFWAVFFLLLLIGASALLCFRNNTGLGQIAVHQARDTIAAGSHLFRLRATLRVASEVYLPILIAAVFVYVTTRIFDKARVRCDKLRASVEEFYLLVALASISISIIAFVYMFTRTFYPAIPQEFGGGKPYYESLAIEESARCKMQQIGIPFEESEPEITKPLPVLHETDTLLAVWLRCPPKKDCNNGTAPTEDPHYVVVQIAKSTFSSTRAYATAPEPPIVPYQPPCNLNPEVNPGINPSTAPANP